MIEVARDAGTHHLDRMSHPLEHLTTALADRYRILEEIGQGGMATVYRATDLRHERDVAIKVLRPELAATLGPERFLQEIRIAAKLTHPHILPVHDSGDADGFLFYVMPHVAGESLRQRIDREHELPVADAVRILREVVDALSHAHSMGVVHRDIKPANIMLSGRHALVTDFGVAKAVSEATGRQTLTTVGVALGTPSYMAPEQAAADPDLDHRVDIYALGAVGYELLAGRPPFTGSTSQAIMVAHLSEAPAPVRTFRASVPEELDDLILRCLSKKAADRWQSAEQLLAPLELLGTPSGGVTPAGTRPMAAAGEPARPDARLVALAAVALVALATWGILGGPDRTEPPVTLGATTQVTFDPGLEITPAISPDGRQVAYAATRPAAEGGVQLGSHTTRIMVRQVGGGRALALVDDTPGSERSPSWRPDGSRLAFDADGRALEVPPLGGAPVPVFSAPAGVQVREPVWSPEGDRLAYRTLEGWHIHVYDPADGTHRPLEGARGSHLAWSPSGEWIAYSTGSDLYSVVGPYLANLAPSAVRVVSPEGGPPVTVLANEHLHQSPAWLPDGRLLLVSTRGGGRDVYAVRLNADGTASGEPERVTTGLDAHTISVSGDGRLLAIGTLLRRQNVWSITIPADDSVSAYVGTPITSGRQVIEGLAVSPDGQRLAYDSNRFGNQDVFVQSLDGGEPVRVTDHPADEFLRGWSPDGVWLTGHGFRNGNRDAYVVRADGTGFEHVAPGPAHQRFPDFSPEGDRLVFDESRDSRVLMITARGEDGAWSPPDSLALGESGRWSPDGSRIAFAESDAGVVTLRPDGSERTVVWPGRAGGGGLARSFGYLTAVEWLSDNELVVLDRRTDGTAAFVLVSARGDPSPRIVVTFDDPLRLPRPEFDVHDGRIYYTVGEFEADVLVAELVW